MKRFLVGLLSRNFCAAVAITATVHELRASTDYPDYKPCAKLHGELHTMGSQSMDAVTLGWLELFRAAHLEIEDTATIEARANTTVVTGLISGESQIGPASRSLFPEEVQAFVKKFGYEPTQIRVCSGAYERVGYSPALVIFVNEENPLKEINLPQLEEIYARDGKITTWGQLGLSGEWAAQPIKLYGLNLPNGIASYFQEAAMHNRDFRDGITTRSTDRNAAVVVRGLSVMVKAVGADRYALCYAGPSNLQPNSKMLAVATDANSPAVNVTRQSVYDHSYPMSRYLYIYINRPPGKPLDPKVKEFLHVVLSRQGQELIEKRSPLLPLPPEVVREELAKID